MNTAASDLTDAMSRPSEMPPLRRPWWMLNGHIETAAALWDTHTLNYESEIVSTPDHDSVLMSWIAGEPSKPVIVLFHGLEGCSQSRVIRLLASYFSERRWTVCVPHFRSCGKMNELPRAYHAADADDVTWMLNYFCAACEQPQCFAAGVSLGGNALIHSLASGNSPVRAAAAISAPLDLTVTADKLSSGLTHLVYGRHFVKLLRRKIADKAKKFPAICPPETLRKIRTIRDVDQHYTAPMHGFASADEYWQKGAAVSALSRMQTPLLCINAMNDPIIPADSLPDTQSASDAVQFSRPAHGGHGGFFGNPADWLGATVHNFFDAS